MDQMPARADENRSLLSVMSFASSDGHDWEVLEGDDGRLVVSVDGLLPYSFTSSPAEPAEEEQSPPNPLHGLAKGEPN